MRKESLAKNLHDNNVDNLWKEVRLINNSSTPLPTNIDGVVGVDKITEIWRKHYFDLFNCIRSNLNNLKYDVTFRNDMIVTASELREAITKLDKNEACGQDSISAEHIMYASERILHMLAMCYTGFLIHGFLQRQLQANCISKFDLKGF